MRARRRVDGSDGGARGRTARAKSIQGLVIVDGRYTGERTPGRERPLAGCASDMDLSGRIVNLVEEGFDLALRATTRDRLDSGLVARPLMKVEFRLLGSPDYLTRIGRPKDFAELNGHALLRYSGVAFGENLGLDGPNGQQRISLRTVMLSENETILHLAALQGMGLVFLPVWMVEADLEAGRLELVLPDILRFGNTLHAVYPSRKYLSAKVRTFIDFLASQIPQDDQGAPLPSALNLLSR